MDTQVLIVDDHAIICEGLQRILEGADGMSVVAKAQTLADGLRLTSELRPNVIVLDIDLPDGKGSEVIQEFHAVSPDSRILAFTAHEESEYLQQVLRAGAAGYVLKMAGLHEVVSAIRTVSQGLTAVTVKMSPDFTRLMSGEGADSSRPLAANPLPSPPADLSEREFQVLRLVAQGYTSQQIGEQLFLSAKTIETYRSRMMKKLGTKNRAELVRYALESGILDAAGATN